MKHDSNRYLNNKFNMLYVTDFIGIKKVKQKDRIRNKYIYKCRCDCGAIKTISSAELGKTESCGCIFKERLSIGHEKQKGKSRPSVQKPNGESVLHTQFLAYKNGAIKRKIEFSITKEQFTCITSKDCAYCGTPPSETKKNKKDFVFRLMNGIDRINSDLGYVIENCTPCCKKCNYMKHKMSINEWFQHMYRIIDHFGNDKRLEEQ